MSLMITGASGFIGSRVVARACSIFGSDNVIAFSSKPIDGCPSIQYESFELNLTLTDRAILESVEILLLVGAFIPKDASQVNSIEDCNSNISFLEKLFAFPFRNLRKVIYLSSVDVYQTSSIISESSPTIPHSFYGWSKLYCEQMASIFALKRGLNCHVLRIGHVYGPGEEKYEKLLPRTMQRILSGEVLELWGNGEEIRSFIYIDDVVTSVLRAVDLTNDLGPINVVGGVAISIKDLLDRVVTISGQSVEIKHKEFKGVKRDLIFDNAKMRQYLLDTETDLTDGLRAEFVYMAGLV